MVYILYFLLDSKQNVLFHFNLASLFLVIKIFLRLWAGAGLRATKPGEEIHIKREGESEGEREVRERLNEKSEVVKSKCTQYIVIVIFCVIFIMRSLFSQVCFLNVGVCREVLSIYISAALLCR